MGRKMGRIDRGQVETGGERSAARPVGPVDRDRCASGT